MVPSMSTARWLACAASALAASWAWAADPYPDHRWSLRGNFGINTPQEPLPGDAFLAVAATRRFGSKLGVETFLGPGLPSTTLAKGQSGAQREVDIGSGLHAAAMFRFEQRLTDNGRGLLSIAAGPSLVSGDAFGTVAMARAEVGFDWRFARRMIASLSMGYEWALQTSRKPFEASDCFHASNCPQYYEKGKGQVSARWGIGFTF
jgi:hypothetical protein